MMPSTCHRTFAILIRISSISRQSHISAVFLKACRTTMAKEPSRRFKLWKNSQMNAALAEIKAGAMGYSKAAKKHGVPRTTLFRLFKKTTEVTKAVPAVSPSLCSSYCTMGKVGAIKKLGIEYEDHGILKPAEAAHSNFNHTTQRIRRPPPVYCGAHPQLIPSRSSMFNTPHCSNTQGLQVRLPPPPPLTPKPQRMMSPVTFNFCPSPCSDQCTLLEHDRRNHQRCVQTSADELSIPIIDLRNDDTKQKLAALGITNYIPLSSETAHSYAVPAVVSVLGDANPNISNISRFGMHLLLSLGNMKTIPTKKSD